MWGMAKPKRAADCCGAAHYARGMCSKHYQNWKYHTRGTLRPLADEKRPWPERFWSKVEVRGPAQCWGWRGARHRHGHGEFRVPGRALRRAHRVMVELITGKPIPPGKTVNHHCDNPPCVNPRHLYIGTQADNNRDRWARTGRTRAA